MSRKRTSTAEADVPDPSAHALLERLLRHAGINVEHLRTSRRIVRRDAVLEKLAISSSTLNGLTRPNSPYYQSEFPACFTLWAGSKIDYWYEDEIDAYVERRKSANEGDSH